MVAEELVDAVDRGEAAAEKTKKWPMSQEQIDFIMSLDVSDYVFNTPIDDMPVSDEVKLRFRASREEAVCLMREHRRANKEIQEWVNSEAEKRGYVQMETTSEMFAKHHRELKEQGNVEVETTTDDKETA